MDETWLTERRLLGSSLAVDIWGGGKLWESVFVLAKARYALQVVEHSLSILRSRTHESERT